MAGARRLEGGFPAHAGMDLDRSWRSWVSSWLPRTRGDGPLKTLCRGCHIQASPHTRGWTLRVPMPANLSGGFPAHAGMDPARRTVSDGS